MTIANQNSSCNSFKILSKFKKAEQHYKLIEYFFQRLQINYKINE